MFMSFDLLVENARIVDGTGAPWFNGSLGITNGQIERIFRGDSDGDAAESHDIGGAIIAPGFIDTHTHSDLQLFDDPMLKPKIRQGITTEILGQDGFSVAPFVKESGLVDWQRHLSGLAGRVDDVWEWGSTGEYLDAIEDNGVAPNVATFVGHGTVRYNVMGMDDRAPTDDELTEMQQLVTNALEEGAIGFSTGLIYQPQSYSDTSEVSAMASQLVPYKRPFVAHIRSEGRWIWDALDEFVDIGDEQGIPLHLSHFKVAGPEQHGKAERAISLIESTRERGVDFTVEQYPYTHASTLLSALLPPWVHAGGPEHTLEYLRDEESRDRIKKDIREWRIDGWENDGALVGWENISISNVDSDENKSLEGTTIAEIADQRDANPIDTICDLLIEEDLQVSMVFELMAEDDVREILSYERVNVASDGLFGGKPHPRVFGTFPRVLGHYSRDENLITLEESIRKMSSLPARAMGLDNKGLIRPGMDADLVILEPHLVESRATYENPNQYPKGILYVLVNGEYVVRDGASTGNTPGDALRA